MGFLYSAPMDALAFTTATDLFEVAVATDRPVKVWRMKLCQTTDLGDAAEEVLRIGLYRGVTPGSTGTGAIEAAYDQQDNPGVTASVNMNRGTASTGGTLLDIIGWNIRIPLDHVWLPEDRPRIDTGEDPFSFRLLSAPADSITVSGALIWEEL